MYEFTREDNTQVLNTMVDTITLAIMRKEDEGIDAIFDFVRKMYEIESEDYEFIAVIKCAFTINLEGLYQKMVDTGCTYTNAHKLTKQIVHELLCNWFRENDIDVYRS